MIDHYSGERHCACLGSFIKTFEIKVASLNEDLHNIIVVDSECCRAS